MDLDESLDVLRSPKSAVLERPIGARPLTVPREVSLDGDKLRWRTPVYGFPPNTSPLDLPEEERERLLGRPIVVQPSRGILERFVRLHRGTDEDIRRFASKWGPLGICCHGLPHTHWPISIRDLAFRANEPATGPEAEQRAQPPDQVLPCWQMVQIGHTSGTMDALSSPHGFTMVTQRDFCQPLGLVEENARGGWEPLERWRHFSEEAAITLRAAAAIHASGVGGTSMRALEADWMLYGRVPNPKRDPDEPRHVDWRWVRNTLDRWMAYGNVRPYLHEFQSREVSVGYGTADSPIESDFYVGPDGFFLEMICGLFGALATQMLLIVCNERGLANCHGCGLPFFTDRKPSPGKHAWCSDPECRKAKNAQAKRESRNRLRRTPA